MTEIITLIATLHPVAQVIVIIGAFIITMLVIFLFFLSLMNF